MSSGLQHIDDFFRKKNETSEVDPASMNSHWQNMNAMMDAIPTAPETTKRRSFKYFPGYAVLLLITCTLIYFAITKLSKENPAGTATPAAEKAIPQPLSKPEHSVSADPIQSRSVPFTVLGKRKTPVKNRTAPLGTIIPGTLVTVKTDSIPGNNNPDNASVFRSFYNELEKPAQEFSIYPGRDTTIICREGTALFIPASCFHTMEGASITGTVTMYVREFYSFADIVSNKLTTQSNGRPLVTGGMLNISASADQQAVMIRPGAAIDLKMPTRVFDPKMQLFTGTGNPAYSIATGINAKTPVDTVMPEALPFKTMGDRESADSQRDTVMSFPGPGINWLPAGQEQFFLNENRKYITVLNLTNNPSEVSYYKKNTRLLAKFRIPFYSAMPPEDIKEALEKKYGRYYDKIKVKREWKPWSKKQRTHQENAVNNWYETNLVGDSITIPLRIARLMKLVSSEDSLNYEIKWRKQYEDALERKQAWSELIQVRSQYNFSITGLGWINCDRFLNFPKSAMTEFAVKLSEDFDAFYFQAILVLDRENSAMPGYWENGVISFSMLPEGESVNVICLGVKDGKAFSSIQKCIVQKGERKELLFNETTPDEFRESLSRFGSVSYKR